VRIFTGIHLFELQAQLNIQGHRGARGHFPENTLQGFTGAIDLGVNTIELDVVISADNKVVVSHEAWMNDEICSMRDGSPVPAGRGQEHNLFRMTYDVIRKFDCGKRGHPRFPYQRSGAAYKPLLGDVINTVEDYVSKNDHKKIGYNIELKTEQDGIFNPAPRVFVDLVYREVIKYDLGDRLNLQSFDIRVLNEIKNKDSSIRIGLLVENNESMETNLERLGFIPYAYNPEFVLVNTALVKSAHEKGMKIFPWTVNEEDEIENMISLGVDGIISDYPDRVVDILKSKGS
jgi:glycerophosphoryl diester phosphodiesterase